MRDNSRARNPDTHRRLGARQGRPSRHVYLSRVRVHLGHDPSASLPFLFHLPPLIEFSEKILSYTDGMDQATFVADALTYDASLRNLELVGEAATHVPSAVRERHPEISWCTIIGARNRLAHGYLSVDDDLIWDIIQNDVPKLLPALRDLLDTTSKDPT